jgi:hypothetical protein
LLTELWYDQINQQPLNLQSSWYRFKVDGELNSDHNNSWNFKLPSIINKSGMKIQ